MNHVLMQLIQTSLRSLAAPLIRQLLKRSTWGEDMLRTLDPPTEWNKVQVGIELSKGAVAKGGVDANPR